MSVFCQRSNSFVLFTRTVNLYEHRCNTQLARKFWKHKESILYTLYSISRSGTLKPKRFFKNSFLSSIFVCSKYPKLYPTVFCTEMDFTKMVGTITMWSLLQITSQTSGDRIRNQNKQCKTMSTICMKNRTDGVVTVGDTCAWPEYRTSISQGDIQRIKSVLSSLTRRWYYDSFNAWWTELVWLNSTTETSSNYDLGISMLNNCLKYF